MKKTLLLLLCIITFALTSKSQNPINPWGPWGIGFIKNSNSLNIYQPYHIEGYQIYYDWADLEPTKDNFKWAPLDNEMRIVADADIWVAVQIMVGPNCPDWIYNTVPKVYTTGGNNDGPYPYYLDPDYIDRYYNLLKQAAEHFNNLTGEIRSHFIYWQITEGSTGDEDPYKGTPTNPKYDIDYYTWEDFRHAAWHNAEVDAGDRYYRFLFNSGNFAQDLQYVDAQYPGDMHKDGLLSHDYSFDGEGLYYLRQYRELNKTGFDNRTRGEVQDIFNKDWWKLAPVKQAFALTCSAASGGLDMLNITPGYINSVFNDTRPTDFFKLYAGARKPGSAHRGFIALRDVPDFADTFRFSVSQYGPVIDPANEAAFEKKINNINNNPKDSNSRKYWLKMKAVVQYINPDRVDKIVNQFKPAGAMYSTTDEYHDDFGVNMAKNFLRFIRQWYPDSSSVGAWRIGPDTSIYGRYARLFKLVQNKGAMYFRFDDSVVNKGDILTVTVTYYDSGNGQWSINCSNTSLKVTNKNTRQWLQKTMNINSFVPRTLYQGQADLALRYAGGTNTPFALIEIKAITARFNSEDAELAREALSLNLSPNPNTGQFKVSFTAKKTDRYSVLITDEWGNLFYTESRQGIAGNNVWNISSAKLQRGAYVLHIESATTAGETKFLVIK
jgi:hypothetical protein